VTSLARLLEQHFGSSHVDGTFIPLFYARSENDMGIGDIGSLFKAVDLCCELGHSVIELLPLTYSSAFNSPYSVLSSRLLDAIYIDIDDVLKKIPSKSARSFKEEHKKDIEKLQSRSRVDYDRVRRIKNKVLDRIYRDFHKGANAVLHRKLALFKKRHQDWLIDHILYKLLREHFQKKNPNTGWDFRTWPQPICSRESKALNQYREQFHAQIERECFHQWILHEQWHALKKYATARKVAFMGDIPYAVDGADIWIKPEIFSLKAPSFERRFTQGVPADMFSDFGQYWQFYAYQWKESATEQFLIERLHWHQEFFTIIRLDHVLGYYRSYLFFEDPKEELTYASLGIWKDIRTIVTKGRKYPELQGDLAWEAYRLIFNALKKHKTSFLPDGNKTFFSKNDYLLQDDAMLVIAREQETDDPEPFWLRQYCVEKAVHRESPMWDFLRISRKNGYQDHEQLCSYLFAPYLTGPRPTDSLRPCFFQKGPGEVLMKKFLAQAQAQDSILISEALGVVPDFVSNSLDKIRMPNYIPLIYGITPRDPQNPYFTPNNDENAFVTFALHDSKTLYTWWNDMDGYEKQAILDHLFTRGGTYNAGHYKDVDEQLHFALLSEVYKSAARIKVLLWSDILLSDKDEAINVPGMQMGQWESRLPQTCTLEQLVAAAKKEDSSEQAVRAVYLLRELKSKVLPQKKKNSKTRKKSLSRQK